MKKKLFAILLMLAMLTPTLAACGNDTPDETDPDTGAETPAETDVGTPAEISDTVELVKDGVSEYVIVRGENATADEIKASTELQSYLKQISGAELPIVTDSTPAVEKEIVIGLTNRETEGQFDRAELEYDGFIIKTEAGKLWLIGGSRAGSLYAVYELLEAYLDCRFFAADLERVPEQKTITLDIAEDKQVPVFPNRLTSRGGVDATLRDKFRWRSGVWASGNSHTLPLLAETGSYWGPDPCLLKPETYDTVLKNVRAALEAKPNADFISLSQADGGNVYCTCTDCLASAEEKGWSGHYLEFVNRIAEEIADEYPNVLLHTFAYQFTTDLPKTDIVAADNVMIQLCTHDNCFSHPLTECTFRGKNGNYETVEEFLTEPTEHYDIPALLEGYSKICKNLSLWDYTENFELYPLDMPCLDVLGANYELFSQYDIVYFYVNSNSGNGAESNFTALKSYLLAKLMWDPAMGEDEYYAHMDEFLEAYFGPGWTHLREYFDIQDKETDNAHFAWSVKAAPLMQLIYDDSNKNREIPELDADTLRNYKDVDWSQYYTYFTTYTMNGLLEAGQKAFAAAIAEAETEDQLRRLDGASIHVDAMAAYFGMTFWSKCISKALPKIYEGNLKARVADGSMTQEEADTLKAAFQADIIDPLKKVATSLTPDLVAKSVKYGITMWRFDEKTDEVVNYWK